MFFNWINQNVWSDLTNWRNLLYKQYMKIVCYMAHHMSFFLLHWWYSYILKDTELLVYVMVQRKTWQISTGIWKVCNIAIYIWWPFCCVHGQDYQARILADGIVLYHLCQWPQKKFGLGISSKDPIWHQTSKKTRMQMGTTSCGWQDPIHLLLLFSTALQIGMHIILFPPKILHQHTQFAPSQHERSFQLLWTHPNQWDGQTVPCSCHEWIFSASPSCSPPNYCFLIEYYNHSDFPTPHPALSPTMWTSSQHCTSLWNYIFPIRKR